MRLLTFDAWKQRRAIFSLLMPPLCQREEQRNEKRDSWWSRLGSGSRIKDQDKDAEAEERRSFCCLCPPLLCFEQRWLVIRYDKDKDRNEYSVNIGISVHIMFQLTHWTHRSHVANQIHNLLLISFSSHFIIQNMERKKIWYHINQLFFYWGIFVQAQQWNVTPRESWQGIAQTQRIFATQNVSSWKYLLHET